MYKLIHLHRSSGGSRPAGGKFVEVQLYSVKAISVTFLVIITGLRGGCVKWVAGTYIRNSNYINKTNLRILSKKKNFPDQKGRVVWRTLRVDYKLYAFYIN